MELKHWFKTNSRKCVKQLSFLYITAFVLYMMIQLIFFPIHSRNLCKEVSIYAQNQVADHLELHNVQYTQTAQFYLWKDQQSHFYVVICEKSYVLPRSRILQLTQLENQDSWEQKLIFEKVQISFNNGTLSVGTVNRAPTLWSYVLSLGFKILVFTIIFCASDFLRYYRQKN